MSNPLPPLLRPLQAASLIALATSVLLLVVTSTALAQSAGDLDPLDPGIVGTYVLATAVQPDGKMIIAGSFSSVLGAARSNIARLNADGTLDAGFDPRANGAVHGVAVQADGKILLWGKFTLLDPNGASTTSRFFIARLNEDGTVDAEFNPRAGNTVHCAALQGDGKILLGGAFSSLRPNNDAVSTSRSRIARLNGDGTLDTSFDPKADLDVYCIVVHANGKILLSGIFTTLQPNGAPSPTPRSKIARLNADGTLDTGFDPKADGAVNSITVHAFGKILLGGAFTTLQPNGAASATARQRIARLNADGTLDVDFDPKANGTIHSMAVQADGKILLGGDFTTLQPNGMASATARQRIARVNPDGTLDTGFDPKADQVVYSVGVRPEGKVLLGGYFTTLQPNGAASATTRNMFALLHNSAASQTLSVGNAGRVEWLRGGGSPETQQVNFELSTDGGTVYAPLGAGVRIAGGWELTGLSLPPNGQLRARGRTSGGLFSGTSGLVEADTAFTDLPVPEISVFTGASTEPVDERTDNVGTHSFGSVSLGGSSPAQTFTVLNSGTANLTGMALTTTGADPGDFTVGTLGATMLAPNASTTFTVTFSPTGNGTRRAVVNIVSNDGNENPFRVNVSGNGPTATDADLSALVLSAGTLSPAFASETINYTACVPFGFSSLTVTPTAAQTDATITVNATPVASGAASGSIALNVGENTLTTVVTAQDGTTQETYTVLVTRAAPVAGEIDPLDPGIVGTSVWTAVMQPDGKMIIAGTFTSVLGVARGNIARLNADGTLDTGFDPKTNGTVFCVTVQADGKILLGGSFTTLQPNGAASATSRQRIGRVNADGTLDTGFDPNASSTVYSVAVQQDGKILLGGSFTTLQPNGAASATSRQRIALVNADGTLDMGFDPKANGTVFCVAAQEDGKILLGGSFTTLRPNGASSATTRKFVARLNAVGTLDSGFNPNPSAGVYAVAVQGDGKILIGGYFHDLRPNNSGDYIARRYFARVNADGTVDMGFDPSPNTLPVYSVAVQADAKILFGGDFTTL